MFLSMRGVNNMETTYRCPYCGAEEVVYGVQSDRGKVRPAKRMTVDEGQGLIHVICRHCGTVIRSYVQFPEKLSE